MTKSNYQSLMDHVGTGKAWDLSRKREGLYILPPFNESLSANNRGKMDGLIGIRTFLSSSKEEYVLFSDCNVICNYDVKELMDFHSQKNSDVTIVCKHGKVPSLNDVMTLEHDEDGKISKITVGKQNDDEADFSTNIILMRKSLLERLLNEAAGLNLQSFTHDIIQRNVNKLNMYTVECDGFFETVDSLQSYFDISMKLLNPQNMKLLFNNERPIYTKERDDMPSIYGLGSNVHNSLIADGCIIDGTVENSIILPGAYISDGAKLDHVVVDKYAIIHHVKKLEGTDDSPVYVKRRDRI